MKAAGDPDRRTLRWLGSRAGLLGRFMLVQGLTQSIGWTAGFIFLRTLTKADYAVYVLTSSAISVVFAVTNSGLVDSVTGIAAKQWKEARYIGQVVSSAMAVRRSHLITAGIPLVLAEWWLFRHNGVTAIATLILLCIAVVTANFRLSADLFKVGPQLNRAIRRVQLIDLIPAIFKLILAITLLRLLNAYIAAGILLVTSILQGQIARWLAERYSASGMAGTEAITTKLRVTFRRQWPYFIFEIFQGQLYILLLATFGSAASVADVGALTSFYLFYGLLWTGIRSIFLPEYAKGSEPAQFRRRYLLIVGGSVFLGALPLLTTVFFPHLLLGILGEKYENLSTLLFLVMLGGFVGFLVDVTRGLNSTRGWIVPSWLMILVDFGTLAVATLLIGVGSPERIVASGVIAGCAVLMTIVGATIVYSHRNSLGFPG